MINTFSTINIKELGEKFTLEDNDVFPIDSGDATYKIKASNIKDYATSVISAGKIDVSEKGAPNGVAELDGSGLVPASQLPSFVDDVLEGTAQNVTQTQAGTFSADGFILRGQTTPCELEEGKTYVDITSNIQYRWTGTGSNLVSMGTGLTLGETSDTAYAGNKGKANADNISALQSGKVDKVQGKGLSTEDYTTQEKTNLSGLMNFRGVVAVVEETPALYAHTTGEQFILNNTLYTATANIAVGDAINNTNSTASNTLVNQITPMVGASSVSGGLGGMVPAPQMGEQDKVLKGDGTWGSVASDDNFLGTTQEWDSLTTAEKKEYKTADITNDFNGVPVDSVLDTTSTNPIQNQAVANAFLPTFIGTQAQWDSLSATQKAKYTIVNINDDLNFTPPIDDELSITSERAVQNKVVTAKLNELTEVEFTNAISGNIDAKGVLSSVFNIPSGYIPKSVYYERITGANGVTVSNPSLYTSDGQRKVLINISNEVNYAITLEGTLHLFCTTGG